MHKDENEPFHPGRMVRPSGISPTLTPREAEIAQLLAQSKTNKEIAEALAGPKASTIGKQIETMLAKFNCQNRSDLVRVLRERGLIEP